MTGPHKNKKTQHIPPIKPPRCFDSGAQFIAWVSAAQQSNIGEHGYCTDCTPTYKAKMIADLRCEHPGVTFERDADGFLCGRRPNVKRRGRPPLIGVHNTV